MLCKKLAESWMRATVQMHARSSGQDWHYISWKLTAKLWKLDLGIVDWNAFDLDALTSTRRL